MIEKRKKRIPMDDQTDAREKRGKTNDPDTETKKCKPKLFTSIYAVRIEMQSIYNRFMAGEIDEKKATTAARILGAPLSELVQVEYLETEIAKLREEVKAARGGMLGRR